MAEKSLDDIAVQDISDRGDMNGGTVYLYCVDKFDLLDKIIEEHINQLWLAR